MSLLIKHIASHDGRLGDRPGLATPTKEHAADADPSATQEDFFGHFFSTPMMAQIRRKNQLLRDANDAVSLIQVADDALDVTTTALCRMRQLSLPPAASQDPVERLTEQLRITEDIWTIAQKTVYCGRPLLNGLVQQQTFLVSDDPEQSIAITIDDVGGMALQLQQKMGSAASREASIGREAMTTLQLEQMETMLERITGMRRALDELQTRFAEAILQLQRLTEGTENARRRIFDVGIAIETSTQTRDIIRRQGEESVAIQANQQPQLTAQLLQ
ncbi:MAG: hypothetical protein H7835_00090 [Magnetococcus sp. XQGC-1]